MKRLYFIGGPMGVGKSSVAEALNEKLENSIFLDGDWCWYSNPFIVNENTKKMVVENISFLLNQFIRSSDFENIIFAWVMDKRENYELILEKLNLENVEVINISLIASEEELRKRLLKDIKLEKRNKDILVRSLERLKNYETLNTVKIDTSGKTPKEVTKI